jgi:hypothetical protein
LADLPKGASSSSLRSPSTTFPLSHRCQVGPTRQIHPLPHVGRPESRLLHASPQLIGPRLPASITEMPIKAPYSPALIPPLESPLTPPPAINSVGRKSPTVTHRHFHPEQPRPPIKGEHHPRVLPHLSPLFSPLSTPEQRSHRAPTPPNLHRRRLASTLLLHLG